MGPPLSTSEIQHLLSPISGPGMETAWHTVDLQLAAPIISLTKMAICSNRLNHVFQSFSNLSTQIKSPRGCIGGVGRGRGGGGVMAAGREVVGSLPPSELDLCEMCHLN